MFDVSFWELMVIALVALVVIGPERLPGVARKAGLWLGRGRRLLGNLKAEIDREIKADEMKQALQRQIQANPLTEAVQDTKDALQELRQGADRLQDSAGQTAAGETSVPTDKGP